MIAENFWMDSTVKHQRVDVGEQGIKEVFSQPFTLFLGIPVRIPVTVRIPVRIPVTVYLFLRIPVDEFR